MGFLISQPDSREMREDKRMRETLEEIKRTPMKKPSGKYNVFNKITRSAGTSH